MRFLLGTNSKCDCRLNRIELFYCKSKLCVRNLMSGVLKFTLILAEGQEDETEELRNRVILFLHRAPLPE